MAKYHGRKGVVYLSTTGTGNATAINLTQWSLNRATDRADVTSFGDANKTYVQGLPDLQGSFQGFWDHADTKLFDAAESADGCKLYLYMSSDASGLYFYGPAWLDSNIEVGVAAAVSISGTFAANGSWGKKLS